MNLPALFAFHVSPVELIVRGTLVYWFLFLTFRFVMRRDAGAVGIADILLVVLVADASQNAMGGAYDTVAEGCVLVATLIGWNVLLDWASYRWRVIGKFVEPAPLLLIDRGRVLTRNLRLKGVASPADVKRAYMESDGKFSVVRFGGKPTDPASGDEREPGA